ncbi:MAG: hypothetical protein HY824_16930 [Acidobacteria bacterium]|nr:hypothetical protein [Acidobacteriota bacterium]
MSRCSAAVVVACVLSCASVATGAQGQAGADGLPAGAAAAILRVRCTTCHGTAVIVQQRLSRAGWSGELDKMTGWGAPVEGAERQPLLDYLATHFSGGARAAAAGDEGSGAALLASRCGACHDQRLIDQQRLDAAGWSRELDKMIGWGAPVADAEREPLVRYLMNRAGR